MKEQEKKLRALHFENKNGRKIYPMGVTLMESGIHVNVVGRGTSCALLLFRRNEEAPFRTVPLDPAERAGQVWSADLTYAELMGEEVSAKEFRAAEYCFADENGTFEDPCGGAFSGRDSWGKTEQYGNPLRSPLFLKPFDWEGDHHPCTPWADTVLYRLNVRSFTEGPASGVIQKGTFVGVTEKLPYLKELGVTALELMPCQEYEELVVPKKDSVYDRPGEEAKPDGRVNLWGYGKAHHYAPKASLCRKKDRDPAGEYRTLVRECHKAGIEVIQELYFDGSEDGSYVTDVLRFYVRFFHVDGIRITGFADTEAASRDPYLSGTKLLAGSWKEGKAAGEKMKASVGDDFLHDMRRYLKGDEDMVRPLQYQIRKNPAGAAAVNFMADSNGFTMADMVSYDVKHNEENGEGNRDGTDWNCSWNCGEEGPTRKKKVRDLRKQQLRNAFLLLFLSQGTPRLLAGDEFCNSQDGNNNAWCADSRTGWLNWKQQRSDGDTLAFVKKCIAFRKKHQAFRMPAEFRMSDPDGCGIPDCSFHGTRVWQPEYETWRRQLGVLYSGHYASLVSGKPEASFYVMYNLHWEPHEFALPHAERGTRWHLAVLSSDDAVNGFYPEGEEPLMEEQQLYTVPARSIAVMIAKPDPDFEKKLRAAKSAGRKRSGKKKEKPEAGQAEKKPEAQALKQTEQPEEKKPADRAEAREGTGKERK